MAMNSTSNNSTSNIRLTLGILGTKVVFQSKKYFFFFFLHITIMIFINYQNN